MEISNIEDYKEILFRLLNIHLHFQVDLQDGAYNNEIRDFVVDNLNDMYGNFADLRIDIEKVIVPKNHLFIKVSFFQKK